MELLGYADAAPNLQLSLEDEIDWRTDYYNEIVAYYQDAVTHQRAMLLYLT